MTYASYPVYKKNGHTAQGSFGVSSFLFYKNAVNEDLIKLRNGL